MNFVVSPSYNLNQVLNQDKRFVRAAVESPFLMVFETYADVRGT